MGQIGPRDIGADLDFGADLALSILQCGGRGLQLQMGQTLRVLKQLSRMCCLCNYICKWLDDQVFLPASSPASSVLHG